MDRYPADNDMKSAALRVSSTLGVSELTGLGLAVASIVATAVLIALAISRGGLVAVFGLAAVFCVLAISFRWPLLPLFAYALLIPIEELLVLGSIGTVSRFTGILFIVAYGLPRLGRLRIGAMPWAGWAYMGWAIFSLIWALDPGVTFDRLPVLISLFLVGTLVAVAVAERPEIVRPLMWTYSLSAAMTAMVGISLYVQGGEAISGRVAALPGQDPAHYAALLLPALAFTLYQLVNGRVVLLSAAVASVCLAGVLVSATRGAWVSATLVILLFILPRVRLSRRVVTVAAIVGVLAVSILLPGVGSLITERSEDAISSGGAGRTDIWTVGITIIRTAPIVGVGLANFSTAYSPEVVRESDVGNYAANHLEDTDPHSIIVGTIAELGVVGFVLLVMFLLPLLARPGWGPDGAAIQAALVSLMISAVFLDLMYRKQVWFVLGIACGLAYLARTERAKTAWQSTVAATRHVRSPAGTMSPSTAAMLESEGGPSS